MQLKYQAGREERAKRSTSDRDISISSMFEVSKEDSVVLTLIDILRQGPAQLDDGKKRGRRWIVLKRKCLMIFKELGQSKPESVIPLSSCFMTESDNNTVMNLSLGDKYFYSLTFEENQKKWYAINKECIVLRLISKFHKALKQFI
ncbi:Rho-GAP domain-containing protein [Entamoeba marina]